MRAHPVHSHDQPVNMTQRVKDFIVSTIRHVEADIDDRAGWTSKQRYWYRRRYGMEHREPIYPWPDSSDIVLPLIDMTIDRLKPLYVGLVTQARPPVSVISYSRENLERTAGIEVWFDWLIRCGSPNFIREVILGVDDVLQEGRAVFKTMWQHETRTEPETLSITRLPLRLRGLQVVKEEKDADRAFLEAGGTPLSEKEFDKLKPQFAGVIAREFQLYPEDSDRDKAVVDKVLAWFRSGAKEPITIKRNNVTVSAPRLVAVDPFDFIMPANACGVEEAPRMAQRLYLTETKLRAQARDNQWRQGAVSELLDRRKKKGGRKGSGSGSLNMETQISEYNQREGVEFDRDDVFELWEVATWCDIDGDMRDEKVIVLVSPELPDMPLKMYAYERPSGRWPYHTCEFELNDRRWYAPRGVPEKLSDIEDEITAQHRGKLNAMAIANAPTFVARKGASSLRGFQWMPGAVLFTQNPTDFQQIPIEAKDFSFEREEQVLRTWAEQYIGTSDFGLANPLSNLTEPRTAKEIGALQSQQRQALSLRGEIFQNCMGEVYGEFFDMWHRYGPDEVWLHVAAQDVIRLTKEEMEGDYLFVPTGTIGETDKAFETAKALARIQILMQAVTTGALGDRYEADVGEAVRDWLEKDDPRASRRILRIRSDEEVQQIREQRSRQEVEELAARANQLQDPIALEGALDRIIGKSKKAGLHGKNQQISLVGR